MDVNLEQQVQKLAITMARMEGKLDASLELKKDVMDIKAEIKETKASLDATDDIAKEARQIAKQNEKDITDILTSVKWGIGIVVTIMMPIALFALSQLTGGQ
ncbi:hypothetical protein [Domibacillus tundrae]|uniref:hypothetical protein n=1 Tax=Domibacillus tundrae TaxID=1587527 RepID=UPI000617E8CF|nr:hypothetical protein [Domibacillus tundrae]